MHPFFVNEILRKIDWEEKDFYHNAKGIKWHLFAMEMKKMCDQWSNVNNEPLMRANVGDCVCSLLSAHSGLLDDHKLCANAF